MRRERLAGGHRPHGYREIADFEVEADVRSRRAGLKHGIIKCECAEQDKTGGVEQAHAPLLDEDADADGKRRRQPEPESQAHRNGSQHEVNQRRQEGG
ncbi:MAG TPA: hypothetical protein VMU01_08915 [Rhizomicrobium sp.]|nr:hypothetical protein [Rhizomicrobium sp.]